MCCDEHARHVLRFCYAALRVFRAVFTRFGCLRGAVQHRACVCSTLLGVVSFFLRSGDEECMTAAELSNSTP